MAHDGLLRAPIGDTPNEVWDATLGGNLTGVYQCCRAALPALIDTRGCIVTIASVAGMKGVRSNAAYAAYGAVRKAVDDHPAEPPPKAILNAPTALMKDLGYGAGYVYAHDLKEGVGGIDCLPDALAGSRFYRPVDRGLERELGERLARFRELREQVRRRRDG